MELLPPTPGSKWRTRILSVLLLLAFSGVLGRLLWMTQMPLKSYSGTLPSLTLDESDLRDRLSADVKFLSVTIGDRNLSRSGSLQAASDYLSSSLREEGYTVIKYPYSVAGATVANLEATLTGSDGTLG